MYDNNLFFEFRDLNYYIDRIRILIKERFLSHSYYWVEESVPILRNTLIEALHEENK